MHGLGVLCGLMPEMNTTSQQLNLVVDLISGMSQKEGESAPLKKLKEALSSKQSFTKHYKELSELAMGTYKHIGRIRSARLIGIDLADFYMKLGEPQKAEGFLMDALKMYRQEGWDTLSDNTRLKLAACQKLLPNSFRYMKTCLHVAASKNIDDAVRKEHFEEAMNISTKLDKDEVYHIKTKPSFHVHQIRPANEEFVINTDISVELVITNNLIKPVSLDEVVLSLASASTDQTDAESKKTQERPRNPSVCSDLDVESVNKLNGWVLVPEVLDIETQYDYENDKSLAATSMVCRTILRRADSNMAVLDGEVVKKDFEKFLHHGGVVLNPGKNSITLRGKLAEVGTMHAVQLCLKFGSLEFLKSVTGTEIQFKIVSEEPSIAIKKPESVLIAGIPQKLTLHLNSGTYSFGKKCSLKIMADQNLEISGEGFADGVLSLSEVKPHQDLTIDIEVLAPITSKTAHTFDVELKMQGDWLEGEHQEHLTFKHPLHVTHKLRTIGGRKFVQVFVQGTTGMDLKISNHSLSAAAGDLEFISLYTKEDPLVVNKDMSVSYMWEVKGEWNKSSLTDHVEVLFSVSYQLATEQIKRNTEFAFSIDLTKTLYIVESAVKSPDKEKCCQVGSSCQLQVTVTPLEKTRKDTVLYEVMTDSLYWCVGGKTSGTLKFDGSEKVTVMDVIPLVGGFLPLPSVKLLKCLDPDSPENIDIPELRQFPRGQVYYRSATSQIKVVPAPAESQIDIA